MGEKTVKLPELNEYGFIKYMNPDLKLSYINSHDRLIRGRTKLEKELDQKVYDRSKTNYDHEAIDLIDDRISDIHKDIALIDDMITDLNVSIGWIATGGDPHSKRGIQRRDVYRKKLVDPLIMQNYTNNYNSRSASTLTAEQRFKLESALSILTKVQRDCYTMQYGEGLYPAYAARLMKMTVPAFRSIVAQAHKKISGSMEHDLFLQDF